MDEAMNRRTLLAAGSLGTAAVALSACTTQNSSPAPTGDGNAPTGTPTTSNVGSTSDVPVGGAVILPAGSTAFVVAQPEEGQFVAHSAVCPHQGCLCNQIRDGEAVCPCHGSRFDAVTGDVTRGPAKTGLAPAQATVVDGNVEITSTIG